METKRKKSIKIINQPTFVAGTSKAKEKKHQAQASPSKAKTKAAKQKSTAISESEEEEVVIHLEGGEPLTRHFTRPTSAQMKKARIIMSISSISLSHLFCLSS